MKTSQISTDNNKSKQLKRERLYTSKGAAFCTNLRTKKTHSKRVDMNSPSCIFVSENVKKLQDLQNPKWVYLETQYLAYSTNGAQCDTPLITGKKQIDK